MLRLQLLTTDGDHSDYSAYSNQAEQERKRKLETAIEDLSTYKKSDINPMLYDKRLKEADAMEVSEDKMSRDVQSRAEAERKRHNKKKRGFRRKNHHGDRPAFGADRHDTEGVMPYDVRCDQPFCQHDGRHGDEI